MLKNRLAGLLLALVFVFTAAVIPVFATENDTNKDDKAAATSESDKAASDNAAGENSSDGSGKNADEAENKDDASEGESSTEKNENSAEEDEKDGKTEKIENDSKSDSADTSKPSATLTTSENVTSTIPSIEVTHNKDTEYVVLLFGKDETVEGGWNIVDNSFVDGKGAAAPSVIVLNPESEKKNGSITVELNESTGKWEVAKESYYGSKLLLIPVIAISFIIVLALTVLVNLIIIKIQKR